MNRLNKSEASVPEFDISMSGIMMMERFECFHEVSGDVATVTTEQLVLARLSLHNGYLHFLLLGPL